MIQISKERFIYTSFVVCKSHDALDVSNMKTVKSRVCAFGGF